MARDDLAAMIAVMQGALEGKEIEARPANIFAKWAPADKPGLQLAWNWGLYEYRLKPEPRRLWVNEYAGGVTGYPFGRKEDAEAVRTGDARRLIEFVEVLP